MFSWFSLAMLALKVLQGLLSRASEAKAFTEGERAQLTKSLLDTTKMVAHGKEISEWVRSQPSSVISDILSKHYTKDS